MQFPELKIVEILQMVRNYNLSEIFFPAIEDSLFLIFCHDRCCEILYSASQMQLEMACRIQI